MVPVEPMMAVAAWALLLQNEDRIQPKGLCVEGFVRNDAGAPTS